MNKFIGISILFFLALFFFINGYNAVFNTEKTYKKFYSQRTKLESKMDSIFSLSKGSRMFLLRLGGWIGMIVAIFLFGLILFVIIFKRKFD